MKYWTATEDARLLELMAQYKQREAAAMLGRSLKSVKGRLATLAKNDRCDQWALAKYAAAHRTWQECKVVGYEASNFGTYRIVREVAA